MPERILFTCAYDGAPYRGWQSQTGGQTLQDVTEAAVAAIIGQPLRIHAAGRTDAGVHARAQRFHLDPPEACRMSAEQWLAALNAHLPGSIRITAAKLVSRDVHARFSATGKVYEYLISRAPVLSPFLRERAWHVPHGLENAEVLRAALAVYEGRHDFRRFAARRGNEPEAPPADFYVRTLFRATVEEEGELLRLRFIGNGFMYRMVRLLTGTAAQVPRGKISLAELAAMLTELEAPKTRYCAPAEGLYLDRVLYGNAGDGRGLPEER